MNRRSGNYPIAIGTSNAIEKIINPFGYDYSNKDLLKCDKLFISVDTLYRNLYGAMENKTEFNVADFSETLIREIEFISEEFSRSSKTKVEFYLGNCKDVYEKFKFAGVIKNKTNAVIDYEHMRDGVIDNLLCSCEFQYANYYDLSFNITEYTDAMIMTHLPYELLRFQNMDNVKLLESHTALVKPRTSWYTKLNNGNKLPPLPFNQLTLLVFGDGYLFKPNKKLTGVIKQCAIDLGWRTDTKYTEVSSSIFKHPLIIDETLELVNNIVKE